MYVIILLLNGKAAWWHGKLASVVRCRVPVRSSALVFIQICEWLPVSEAPNARERCIRTATAAAAVAYCILWDDCFIVRSLFVSIYSICFFAQRWVCPFFLHRHSTSRTSFFVFGIDVDALCGISYALHTSTGRGKRVPWCQWQSKVAA